MSLQIESDWESRIDEHIRNIDTRNSQYSGYRGIFGDEEGNSGDSFHLFLDRQVVLEQAAIDLELDEIQRLPEYLCELTIRTENSEVCLDHFEYWAWTGAIASYMRLFGDHPIDDEALGDLCLLIQISLFTHRNRQFWKSDPYWYNPSYLAILIENFNLVTLSGYPILEGLLRRHCDQTNPDGTVKNGHESVYNQYVYGSHAYIGDLLELWLEENTSTKEVKESLGEIDEFADNLEQELQHTFQGLSFIDVANSDSFLDILRQIRNANVHGETSTQAIGSILVSISSLVFWDSIDNQAYQDAKQALESAYLQVDRDYSDLYHGFFPDGFYPLGQQSMKEPDPDGIDLYRADDYHIVRFGKNKRADDVAGLIQDLRSQIDEQDLKPSKLKMLISTTDGGEKTLEVEFSEEDSSLDAIEDAIKTAISYPTAVPDESRPLEIWLYDAREPEATDN